MVVAKHAGRSTRRYKKLKAQFRAQCTERKATCHLCDQEIDYSLEYPDPESFTLDHLYPVSQYPELSEDPGNFRASHAKCNWNRSTDKAQGSGLGQRTRD